MVPIVNNIIPSATPPPPACIFTWSYHYFEGGKMHHLTFPPGAGNGFQFMFFQNDYLLQKKKNLPRKSPRDNETFHTSIPTIYLPLGRSLLASLSPREPGIQTLKWMWGLGVCAVFRPAVISTPVFILQVLMGKEGKWLPYASPHLFQMQRETHT